MILGGLLTWGSFWMLGYRPSKSESKSSESLDALIQSFPNKKLTYWKDRDHYELHLYGAMAFIRRPNRDHTKTEIDPDEFKAIWDQFQKLPNLEQFKNRDAYNVVGGSTHSVVFINDAAGLYLFDRWSYSIPRDEAAAAYREWFDQIETTIRKYESQPATSLNGNQPSS